MLYVTTKSNKDVFTANRTLCSDMAENLFVPYRMPMFSKADLDGVLGESFNEAVANILNLFFPVHFSGWDVEFAVGKFTKVSALGQKVVIAELWHNHDTDFACTESKLFTTIGGDEKLMPTQWFRIVIRIAVLFGVYGELLRSNLLLHGQKLDVSVNAENMAEVVAALYAKQMGLPVGTVIFACNENSVVWEFLRRGCINMSAQNSTTTDMLERIIHGYFGQDEALRFYKAAENNDVYRISPEQMQLLGKETFAAAVGKARLDSVVNSVKRTDGYDICAYTARGFGGLQDFRASIGESRMALLFSERVD